MKYRLITLAITLALMALVTGCGGSKTASHRLVGGERVSFTGLGSGTAHQLKPVHAHNGRYTVNQIRHVFADVGLTCKRSPTFAGLVILGCRFPARTFGLSAFISNPRFKGAILYGLTRIPGTHYTRRGNITLAYRPAVQAFAQVALSLLR